MPEAQTCLVWTLSTLNGNKIFKKSSLVYSTHDSSQQPETPVLGTPTLYSSLRGLTNVVHIVMLVHTCTF